MSHYHQKYMYRYILQYFSEGILTSTCTYTTYTTYTQCTQLYMYMYTSPQHTSCLVSLGRHSRTWGRGPSCPGLRDSILQPTAGAGEWEGREGEREGRRGRRQVCKCTHTGIYIIMFIYRYIYIHIVHPESPWTKNASARRVELISVWMRSQV